MGQPTTPRSPSLFAHALWYEGISEGIPPSPYSMGSGYIPYQHIERECPHCIGMFGQKRRLEENERVNSTFDKKARVEEKREEKVCEDTSEDMDVDMMEGLLSTYCQDIGLMMIGGKRKLGTGESEGEENPAKTKSAGTMQHLYSKRKRDVVCDEESVPKRKKTGRESWGNIAQGWRSDRVEWFLH